MKTEWFYWGFRTDTQRWDYAIFGTREGAFACMQGCRRRFGDKRGCIGRFK